MDPNGEIDSTNVFEKEVLDAVYQKVSPCVVAVLPDPSPASTAFIVKTTNTHNLIAVQSSVLGYMPDKNNITIRYYDGMIGSVDRIERLPGGAGIVVLYSPHLGNPGQAVTFGELEDTDCQKIVTLFSYKNDLMLCKGHITFPDCTSENRRSGQIVPGGEKLFMFTCPVSDTYDIDGHVSHAERDRFLRMIQGAAVFDLDGRVIGRIKSPGLSHHMKFAMKSSAFRADLSTLEPLDWQDEEEKEKKQKANDLSSSDEEREPTPMVRKAKKEKMDKKKGRTEAEEEVNDDRKLTATCEDDPANLNALASFQISESLKQKLKSNGINALNPIQAITFRQVLNGNDLVGHARTGQGKTLAFVLPILESLCNGPHMATRSTDYGRPPSVLVLVPTRELANQLYADFKFYGGAFGLSTCCAYECSHYRPQEIAMRKGIDIVVGTPGRVKDFIVKGTLSLKCLKYRVLDEADEMLNMGFAEDVEFILGMVEDVTKVQTLLFSATLPEWVKKLSMRFLKAEKGTVDLVANKKMKASAFVRHLALPYKFSVTRIERKFGVKFEQISALQRTDSVQSAGNEAVDVIAGAEKAAMVTLDEVKQLPALQKREPSRGKSGGLRFGNEAADAVASVSDSVIPVFRQQAVELLSCSSMSAVDLLPKALAKAVGYTDIKKRSLLSSIENCTTLHITTGRTMYTPSCVISTLKTFMPEDRLSNVQGVALTANGRGAVFDVPSAEVQDYLQGVENAAGVTLDEVTELPALQEREHQPRSGGSRYGGGGGGPVVLAGVRGGCMKFDRR